MNRCGVKTCVECPNCHDVMELEQTTQGEYLFFCRKCSFAKRPGEGDKRVG